MAEVVPTVNATTPEEYATMLALAESLSPRVHVDICDGQFADNQTVGLAQVHVSEGVKLDLHLMLQDPTAELETALSLQPHVIIFHAESSGDIAAAITHCRELGVKAGVAILPETSIEAVRDVISKSDHILVFTGDLGHNGGEFNTEQLDRIATVKSNFPEAEVSVDGGVSDRNAALITLQGADVLYAGSFLQQAPDPTAAWASIERQAGAES